MQSTQRLRASITVAAAVLALCGATACGKSGIGSPLAPSSSGSPAPASSGALITGQVTTGAALSSGAKVTVVGTSQTAVADNSGRFRLEGVRSGETELEFEHGSLIVRVGIGSVTENERVELRVSLSSGGSLEASEHVRPDDSAAVFGRIASINAGSRSLQVGAFAAQVAASADIKAHGDAVDFSALQVGQLVELEGAMQANVMVATKVRLEDDHANPGNGVGPANEVELTASIASLGGSCPQRTLNVGGVTFVTSAATSFERTSCDALAAGMLVQAKGTRQSNGNVAASRVRLEQ